MNNYQKEILRVKDLKEILKDLPENLPIKLSQHDWQSGHFETFVKKLQIDIRKEYEGKNAHNERVYKLRHVLIIV